VLHLFTAPAVIFAQSEGGSSALGFLLPIAILGGVFYLLLILPQRRRAKKAQSLQESLGVGNEIRTIGGMRPAPCNPGRGYTLMLTIQRIMAMPMSCMPPAVNSSILPRGSTSMSRA